MLGNDKMLTLALGVGAVVITLASLALVAGAIYLLGCGLYELGCWVAGADTP